MHARAFFSRAILAAVCFAIVFGSATVASACPSCQAALAADGSDLGRGIYYSILFMMSMPFAIVGTFGCFAYRAVKREQQRQAAAGRSRGPDSQPREF